MKTFRKTYSNWLYDGSREFRLNDDPPTGRNGNNIRVDGDCDVSEIRRMPGHYMIVRPVSFDGSTIRHGTESDEPSNDCLLLLRIATPTDIQLFPSSSILVFRDHEGDDIDFDETRKFIRIRQVSKPFGIIFRLEKFGTVFIYYQENGRENHCFTYDGEFLFFSGAKMEE